MIRGTTPTLEFILPFDTRTIAEAYVTFAQNSEIVLDKKMEECACDGEKLTLCLTQKDTLAFCVGKVIEIQLRVRTIDGEALASNIISTTAERIIKDGEI